MLLVLLAVSTAPAALVAEPVAEATGQARWLGVDGEPLPFTTDEQVVDFLSSAPVIASKILLTGITRPLKLTLNQGGVEAHAVFHDVDEQEDRKVRRVQGGGMVLYFRDSYHSQIAAYELSRLLGMDNVPPTVTRRHKGTSGSLQLWVEGGNTERARRDRGLKSPNPVFWNRQRADMWVFDNLINNIDRNQGNILIDEQWNLWLIDHTRAFGRDHRLALTSYLSRCSRRLWEALKGLDRDVVQLRLGDHLNRWEIQAIFKRRDRLVEWFESRIAELGEDRVLFRYGEPEVGVILVEDVPDIPEAPDAG